MNGEHLAKEAARLLNDEVLLQAIADAQRDAMGSLVTVDADDKTEILRLQAQVKAFTEILDVLKIYVLRQSQNSEPLNGPLA